MELYIQTSMVSKHMDVRLIRREQVARNQKNEQRKQNFPYLTRAIPQLPKDQTALLDMHGTTFVLSISVIRHEKIDYINKYYVLKVLLEHYQ